MNNDDITNLIKENNNDIIFIYNNMESGVSSEVYNSIPIYQVWYGNTVKEYLNSKQLFSDKLFDGKTILEVLDEVDFELC